MPSVRAEDATLTFRPLRRDDLPTVGRWLDDPVVHRWWPDPHSLADLETDYGSAIDETSSTQVFAAELDGRAVGMIQRYPMDSELEWVRVLAPTVPDLDPVHTAGIDYLLGPADVRGRGVGTRMVAAFTAALFRDWAAIEVIVVAVQQQNPASWRALERCGYRRRWGGRLDSDDPSDAGPAFVYTYVRADSGAA
jgi:aminoglycoside 6'-N-acetyltransferase